MTKRQREIANLITESELTADVGCDHGILSLYVLQNNLAKNLVATDISAPSLDKTINLLRRYGLLKRAKCVVCDGLPTDYEFDQVLIAGMGGREICKILSNYFAHSTVRPVLVLQPMRDFVLVRKLLIENGYKICEDKIIYDKKFYLLLRAELGEQTLTQEQMLFGAVASNYFLPDFARWLDYKIEKTTQILGKIAVLDRKHQELSQFLQQCKDIKGRILC